MATNSSSKVWVSHSSISDFLKCPRLYYLRNLHKSKTTNRKMTIMTPPLALGQAVHDCLDSLSYLPREERFAQPLLDKFDEIWTKVEGKKGGFRTPEEEENYKERGRNMIKRVAENPGLLQNKAVKIQPQTEKDRLSKFDLPYYHISQDDGIILCGKIDWLEYIDNDDSVHIVDFKTGKNEEDEDSLQLPIYLLLAKNCQKFNVSKVSYWYLDRDNSPSEAKLPRDEDATESVMTIARRIKLARQLELFKCPKGENGCFACTPFEAVLRGSGELVGVSGTNQDIYVLLQEKS